MWFLFVHFIYAYSDGLRCAVQYFHRPNDNSGGGGGGGLGILWVVILCSNIFHLCVYQPSSIWKYIYIYAHEACVNFVCVQYKRHRNRLFKFSKLKMFVCTYSRPHFPHSASLYTFYIYVCWESASYISLASKIYKRELIHGKFMSRVCVKRKKKIYILWWYLRVSLWLKRF